MCSSFSPFHPCFICVPSVAFQKTSSYGFVLHKTKGKNYSTSVLLFVSFVAMLLQIAEVLPKLEKGRYQRDAVER